MARYKKYPNLPWWLNNLNHHTLTPTEKEVLDTDYYCLPHGTKLSHQQTADVHHRSRQRIYETRRRLAKLGLRTTEPAKGSFLVGRPIEYQDEAEWLAALRARGFDTRRLKNKRKSSRERPPLGGLSLSKVKKVASVKTTEAGVSHPQTAGASTDRCSGGTVDYQAKQKARTEQVRELQYRNALRKLCELGYDEPQAKNLAQIKADKYIAKRATWYKPNQQHQTEDQGNPTPNSD